MSPETPIPRREAIHRAFRYGGLATLAGVGGWLGKRSLDRGCPSAGPCGGCPRFEGCALPKAESAKRAGNPLTYPTQPEDG